MKDSSLPSHGPIQWFLHNHALVNILMLFIIVTGLLVVRFMIKEVFPTVDPRTIVITVPYPGASAEDIADGVTRRVEEAVLGIQGVKRVQSVAQEGSGVVTVELEDFAEGDAVLTDVETEIDSLREFPPQDAEEVQIVRTKVTPQVMTIAVYGEVSELALNEWAEHIEERLLALPGISLTELQGNRAREISILVSEAALRKYQLSLLQVAEQLERFSLDIPAGNLKTEASEILLRVREKREHGFEFESIPIKSDAAGRTLRLGDIAQINDGFEDDKFLNTFNGIPAVFVVINRSSSQDNIVLQQEVQGLIEELRLPRGINVSIWKDDTNVLKDRINLLARNAILGLSLVFLSLVVFLDLRLAFWTSVGIAISFLGGLAVASMFGVTMNMITLFALIVVLGVVVDDAIVTGESIFSEQENKSTTAQDATLLGVKKVVAPVSVGVLTTVCAFAPLLLSTGTLGQILRTIPIIVISILLMSLLEAFVILPAHLDGAQRWSIGILSDVREFTGNKLHNFVEGIYLPCLQKALAHPWRSLCGMLLIIIIPFILLKLGVSKFVFFPSIESDEIRVELEMPVGTPYETTEKVIREVFKHGVRILAKHSKAEGIALQKSMVMTIGGSLSVPGGPRGQGSPVTSANIAQIQLLLVPSAERAVSAFAIEREWQSATASISGFKKLSFESSLIHGGSDINLQLEHRDGALLEKASEELKMRLASFDHVYEVADSSELGKLEYVFKLTDEGIAAGMTPASLGAQLRSAFFGYEVQRIQRGRNEIKVMVRLSEQERRNFATIDNFRVTLPNGERMALSTVANPVLQQKVSSIRRVDGRRVIEVTGDVDESEVTPNEVLDELLENTVPELMRHYPGLKVSVEGDSKDQRNDLMSLAQNSLIAVFLIFVLLTGQLRSYAKPFIIVLTIPLGIAGAIYGHLLLGYTLSFISLFGIVALAGVVVNDSVVLVDYYNSIRGDMPAYDAILDSCRRRFRPILLTTLTTSLGLLPMLTETSLQARFIIPMAISLGCGVLFASALLVFFIPVSLLVYEQLAERYS